MHHEPRLYVRPYFIWDITFNHFWSHYFNIIGAWIVLLSCRCDFNSIIKNNSVRWYVNCDIWLPDAVIDTTRSRNRRPRLSLSYVDGDGRSWNYMKCHTYDFCLEVVYGGYSCCAMQQNKAHLVFYDFVYMLFCTGNWFILLNIYSIIVARILLSWRNSKSTPGQYGWNHFQTAGGRKSSLLVVIHVLLFTLDSYHSSMGKRTDVIYLI